MTEAREMPTGMQLALAQADCTHCMGLGHREGRNGKRPTCHCVWRSVFRSCYARFRRLVMEQGGPMAVYADPNVGRAINKPVLAMRPEDFMADFRIVAERALRKHNLSRQIFKFHFLYGADHRLCSRKLRIDRGEFFHEVYRVQQRVGKALFQTEPHALYPVYEYFSAIVRSAQTTRALEAVRTTAGKPLRAPLRKAAA